MALVSCTVRFFRTLSAEDLKFLRLSHELGGGTSNP
jgi:hypothetical protein